MVPAEVGLDEAQDACSLGQRRVDAQRVGLIAQAHGPGDEQSVLQALPGAAQVGVEADQELAGAGGDGACAQVDGGAGLVVQARPGPAGPGGGGAVVGPGGGGPGSGLGRSCFFESAFFYLRFSIYYRL